MSKTEDINIFREEDETPLEKSVKRKNRIARITLVVWIALYTISFMMNSNESLSFSMLAIIIYAFLLILASGRAYIGFRLAALYTGFQFVYFIYLITGDGWHYELVSIPTLFLSLMLTSTILLAIAAIAARKLELQKKGKASDSF